jgi:hypothetical protein
MAAEIGEELWSEAYDDGYTISMVRGERLGPLDVKVMHKHERARRAHAPKHMHWVDDVLRKAEYDSATMCEFMTWALDNYHATSAWPSESEQTDYSAPGVSFYSPNELPGWDIEHLVTLIDILSINEQLGAVGNPNVYRFRELMEQVKEYVCGDLEDTDLRRTITSTATRLS